MILAETGHGSLVNSPVPMTNSEVASLATKYLSELLETQAPVTLDNDFFDLGGDSFAAVELANFVSGTINRRVPVKLIYDAPLLRNYIAAVGALGSSSDE
jgi:acyl carrier protein